MIAELNYLYLLENLIEKGEEVQDRTGVGTKCLYGKTLQFNLKNNTVPLLTTKKVYWKGIVEELIWFINGETDSKILERKNVNIWKGNTSREFLDKHGLDYPEGEIGPGYGYQWRCFDGDYPSRENGFDQFKSLVDGLKSSPDSRRHILTAWNPKQVSEMALPPCHVMSHYKVINGVLHSSLFQRSADACCGIPFNIASYGLLTILLANECGYKPGTFTWFGADVHIYMNHIDLAKTQISREPYDFPTVSLSKKADIFNLTASDIELNNYRHYESLKYEMAI
jgi:thymidylate synthase